MGVAQEMAARFEEVDQLVFERALLRQAGRYADADRVREEIDAIRIGTQIRYRVALQDDRVGSLWHWTVEQ